jgi:hypothetical protein
MSLFGIEGANSFRLIKKTLKIVIYSELVIILTIMYKSENLRKKLFKR